MAVRTRDLTVRALDVVGSLPDTGATVTVAVTTEGILQDDAGKMLHFVMPAGTSTQEFGEDGELVFKLIPTDLFVSGGAYHIAIAGGDDLAFAMPDADTTYSELKLEAAGTPGVAYPGSHGWTYASSAPSDVEAGHGWVDSTDNTLSVWDGSQWREVAGGGGGGTSVSPHTPADGDAELAGIDIAGTDYELVDRLGRDRLHLVEQRVRPIHEVPQTWADVSDAAVAGWSAAAGLLTAVDAIAALAYSNSNASGTTAQFVYARIPVGAQQSTYRFRYTIGGGSQNGQIHDRVLGTWSGEHVGDDTDWAYYRIAFYEGDTFSTGRLQLGTGDFEWEGALTRDAVQDQLDAIGVPQAIDALKSVTRDLLLEGATDLVKNSAAATAAVARVAVANSARQAIEAGTQNLDVQGVTFTATLVNAHFGSTATTTDLPVVRLSKTEDRSDWRILFDSTAFLAGGWVPINASNGSATHDYYISGKVDRTKEIALYKSEEETTYHGALAGGAGVTGIWAGTKAEYDALSPVNPHRLYIVKGDGLYLGSEKQF